MTIENPRMRVMRDDALNPMNPERFDEFIEGFMMGLIAMGLDPLTHTMDIRSVDPDWKEYKIFVINDEDSSIVTQYHFNPQASYDEMVKQFQDHGYSRSDAEELIMVSLGFGPQSVKERLKGKAIEAMASDAALKLGIEPTPMKDGGFKPDKGEA
jgi:hypothetical protein